jgi:HSP20 family protein
MDVVDQDCTPQQLHRFEDHGLKSFKLVFTSFLQRYFKSTTSYLDPMECIGGIKMVTVTRWNPFREMAAMQSSLDRLFDDSWRTVWPTTTANQLPLDLYETDNSYVAMIAVPGLNQDQINIRFENGVLQISADMPHPQIENARVLIQERAAGQYSRTINLSELVDVDQAEAHYENGVLHLTLPKSPAAQPKRISIKTNGQAQLQPHN